jgi:hypothetical protein
MERVMRSGLVFVMIAGAMGLAWAATNALHNAPAIDRDFTTASIEKPAKPVQSSVRVFKLSSAEASSSCMVVRGETLSPGYSELKVNPACDRVFAGLTNARFWRERADGSVAFVGADNAAIAEFTIGDGVDYESYQPSTAMLSMWAE